MGDIGFIDQVERSLHKAERMREIMRNLVHVSFPEQRCVRAL